MRHVQIPIDTAAISDWIKKANEYSAKVASEPDHQERQKLISKYSNHWREPNFRRWLTEIFHGKCWFTESKGGASRLEIEHFRPKGGVKEDPAFEGYWWLAFDWKNYCVVASSVNRIKSTQFPLQPKTRRASYEYDDLDVERPMLLDPRIESDVDLLQFSDNGEPVPASGISEKQRARVLKTIEVLGLNTNDQLYLERKTKWHECKKHVDEYKGAATSGLNESFITIQKITAKKRLRDFVKITEPYSRMCQHCVVIQAQGQPELVASVLSS